MTTEPSLNIEDLRRVAEAAIADHADDVARADPDDRPDLWDAPVAEVPASQLLSLLDRISSVEAEREALRDRNRRLKEANDEEHHRLAGSKDKAHKRAVRAEQRLRDYGNTLQASEARALSLEAEKGRLREALEPFAAVARLMAPLVEVSPERWPDDRPNSEFIPGDWPRWEDFRRASQALAEIEGKQG